MGVLVKGLFCFLLLSSCYIVHANKPLTIYIARERAAIASDGRDRWEAETTISLPAGWDRQKAEQSVSNALDEAMENCQFDTQRICGQIQCGDNTEVITEAFPTFVTKFNEMLAQHDSNPVNGTVTKRLAVVIARLGMSDDGSKREELQEKTSIELPLHSSSWEFAHGKQHIHNALAKAMTGCMYSRQRLLCKVIHGGTYSQGGYVVEYRNTYPVVVSLLKKELAQYDSTQPKK